ncbi:hypothetical protein HanHA89_Chr13g0501671 [Helianthus annuus]|nr:hypothetical protein HanHA89_Chr13g0501671 [Helianthus annuus]
MVQEWKSENIQLVTPVSPRQSNKYQTNEILYFILGILCKYVYLLHVSILVRFRALNRFLEGYTQSDS